MPDNNARIAEPMAEDPKWREWAFVACPKSHGGSFNCPCHDCHGIGRIPRDFADPENTRKLVEWGVSKQWWKDGYLDYEVSMMLLHFKAGSGHAAHVALRIRDMIAARLKEIDDGH